MKLKLLALTTFFALAPTTRAGLLDSMLTSNMPVKETTAYKIDVHGYDARIYEFTSDSGMQCLFLATGGDTNTAALQCHFKKED